MYIYLHNHTICGMHRYNIDTLNIPKNALEFVLFLWMECASIDVYVLNSLNPTAYKKIKIHSGLYKLDDRI